MSEPGSQARWLSPPAGDPWRADGVVLLRGVLCGEDLEALGDLRVSPEGGEPAGIVATTACVDSLLANPDLTQEVLARVGPDATLVGSAIRASAYECAADPIWRRLGAFATLGDLVIQLCCIVPLTPDGLEVHVRPGSQRVVGPDPGASALSRLCTPAAEIPVRVHASDVLVVDAALWCRWTGGPALELRFSPLWCEPVDESSRAVSRPGVPAHVLEWLGHRDGTAPTHPSDYWKDHFRSRRATAADPCS